MRAETSTMGLKHRILLGFIILGIAAGGFKTQAYIQNDPAFCTSCHLMEEAFHAWENSSHNSLTCHTCHKSDYGRDVRRAILVLTENPSQVGPHTRLPTYVCEACHVRGDPKYTKITNHAGHKKHYQELNISCLSCHAQTLHQFKPPAEVCAQCHAEEVKIKGMGQLHCLNCHNYLLNESASLIPTRGACLHCHEKLNPEIVLPRDVPMQKLKCFNCHFPHSEESPLSACENCHVKDPDHTKNQVCSTCHRPHEWRASLQN